MARILKIELLFDILNYLERYLKLVNNAYTLCVFLYPFCQRSTPNLSASFVALSFRSAKFY